TFTAMVVDHFMQHGGMFTGNKKWSVCWFGAGVTMLAPGVMFVAFAGLAAGSCARRGLACARRGREDIKLPCLLQQPRRERKGGGN
ncbi:hypothetical protein A2U01_0055465, partial [Trifolium medium]|nr:hypothetical protein [Trifolium medium]